MSVRNKDGFGLRAGEERGEKSNSHGSLPGPGNTGDGILQFYLKLFVCL